jgi:hypothetical protein
MERVLMLSLGSETRIARWVRLISVAASSMAGVLSDELKTSSGRQEGCPGSRAMVGRPALAVAFADSGDCGASDRRGSFLARQARARCPGCLHTRQWTGPLQSLTKWLEERQRKQSPSKLFETGAEPLLEIGTEPLFEVRGC